MNLSVGIVGLPNVGKSTLFNALLKKQQALAANYPFATIEPNVGIIPVPDERLQELAEVVGNSASLTLENSPSTGSGSNIQPTRSSKLPPIVPTTVQFVDIAGLVKGASEGAGLGNKFLSHIREVSIIAHVVRAFEDPNVIKEGAVDPKTDYETVRTELILADLQTLSKTNEKTLKTDLIRKSAIDKLDKALNEGKSAFEIHLTDEEQASIKELGLLSAKPEIVVLNVAEADYNENKVRDTINQYVGMLGIGSEKFVVISAQIESELAALSDEEQRQYLKDLGLTQSGLERLIRNAYKTLGLISFLTAGEKEVRAWTIKKGTNAQIAAGEIHTDFIKKFIKAEVISFEDFVQYNGWKGAREAGKTRLEGKDYIVKDGDVVEFKIGS